MQGSSQSWDKQTSATTGSSSSSSAMFLDHRALHMRSTHVQNRFQKLVPDCPLIKPWAREHGLFLLGVKHELQQQKSRARNHSARPTGNSASPSRRVLVLIHLTEKNWGRRCSHIRYYPLLFIRSPNNDLRSRLGIELGTSPREGRVLTNCGNPCSFGPDGLISVGGGGVGYCHIWAIQVCAAVKAMVFKQFTLG